MGHKWQSITKGIFWCEECGSLKNVAGGQTAFCPVRGTWSYTDPPCREESVAVTDGKIRLVDAPLQYPDPLIW